jgi:sigma-B regulation protein RsbU (phosphoserine phosphatase)
MKTLRLLARQFTDLRILLSQFNDELKPDLLPGQFLTLCAAALDTATGHLEVLRAGHYSAILAALDRDAPLRRVGAKGMAMGLAGGSTFAATLRPENVELAPGDVLLLYTDGAVEAPGADGEAFGEGRIFAGIMQRLEKSTQDLVDGIAADVRAYAGGRVDDDLTFLALGCSAGFEDDPALDEASG